MDQTVLPPGPDLRAGVARGPEQASNWTPTGRDQRDLPTTARRPRTVLAGFHTGGDTTQRR
eukprot:7388222-Lingulodinium_polyedra.AAC.1